MALLVAGIDFGTTYSGWAFSFKHEFERDPIKVSAKQWSGGQLVSQKGPTCVLIKPDGRTLEAFGYEAETKYAEYAEDEQHHKYYYFRRFKMLLFGRIGLERNLHIEDATGKRLPAKTVFSLAIRFLKDDLLQMSEKQIAGGGLSAGDVHWVLTVPAIWNDPAKQFMREAAEAAGISSANLSIALEPEAASLYCRHLPVEKGSASGSLASFKSGTKYLVLDAGGGTVDITVHEVTVSGDLKELHKASGGAWGGTKVDDAFENFIDELAGVGIMEKFKDRHMEDYVDLLRDFEIKKRDIKPGKEGKINFRVPVNLTELVKTVTGKTFSDGVAKSRYSGRVKSVSDKLRVDADVAVSLFENTVKSIVDHVASLLSDSSIRGCSTIVMVGGFSDSPVLQQRIKDRFSRLNVISPAEAGLAVLKGAVIFGHQPTAIAERVCKFTYGHGTTHKHDPTCSHRVGKRERDANGEMRCYDIFSIHVKVGQTVKLGEEQAEIGANPVRDDQTAVGFPIYVSSKPNPELVTDVGCSRIGNLDVPIPDTSLGRNRKFGISFLFGGTEIEVKVVDKNSGKKYIKRVDFLG